MEVLVLADTHVRADRRRAPYRSHGVLTIEDGRLVDHRITRLPGP